MPSAKGNANKFLRVASDEKKIIWQEAYPPTAKGSNNQVWASRGADSTPTWKGMGSILNSAADNADQNKYLKARWTGDIYWQIAYPPTSTGKLGYVWGGNDGEGATPSWKSIGGLLNSAADNANAGKFLKAGNTGYFTWASIV